MVLLEITIQLSTSHGGSMNLIISWIELEASLESHRSELKVLQLRFTGSITNLNHSLKRPMDRC
jgi:hypothetical protein